MCIRDRFGHDPRIYETTVKEFIADDKGRLKAVKTIMPVSYTHLLVSYM